MISKVLAVWALCLLLVQASHGCLNISPKVPQLKDEDGMKYTSQILGILAAQTEKPSDEVGSRFMSYGCYCGLGGKGTARDALDKCCQKHDACYETFHSNNALLGNYGLEYTYTFDFKSDKATCVADQAKDKLIKCGCDLRLGECMKEHWDSYSDDYKGLRFTKDWEKTCKKDPTESVNSLLDKLPHMNKL